MNLKMMVTMTGKTLQQFHQQRHSNLAVLNLLRTSPNGDAIRCVIIRSTPQRRDEMQAITPTGACSHNTRISMFADTFRLYVRFHWQVRKKTTTRVTMTMTGMTLQQSHQRKHLDKAVVNPSSTSPNDHAFTYVFVRATSSQHMIWYFSSCFRDQRRVTICMIIAMKIATMTMMTIMTSIPTALVTTKSRRECALA